MSVTLVRLFERLVCGKKVPAGRRKATAVRPQVECLGERVLPATGVGSLGSMTSQLGPFAADKSNRSLFGPFSVPSLVGKSVEITNPSDPDPDRRDIGTVVFTGQDLFGNFQGTFECHLHNHFALGFGAEKYEASMDMGTIPISGSVGTTLPSLSTGWVSYISFHGDWQGMVTEHHHYLFDDPGNPNNPMEGTPEDEIWRVSDRQTISFTGGLSPSGSGLTLAGNVDVTNRGQWLGSLDHLAPGDRNHTVVPLRDVPATLNGLLTLDQEVHPTMLISDAVM